ncbi:hypothetical protein Tco_1264996 [Tanacetum coccineum]
MCMFALTVSRTEPKNIKEAMADSAWIESMQEELHQFDRLDGYAQMEGINDFDESIFAPVARLEARTIVTLQVGPDIVHENVIVLLFKKKPIEKHLAAVKRIFWYLKNTINMGLWYPKDIGFELTAFLDSDHAGCLDLRCHATVQSSPAFSYSNHIESDIHFIKEHVDEKGIVEIISLSETDY